MMPFRVSSLAVAAALLLSAGIAQAQPQPLETYVARLSGQDHYNSNGVRLMTAAGIIRQDRANFYEFGKRDREDTPDAFFSSLANRALLEQMLLHGTISGGHQQRDRQPHAADRGEGLRALHRRRRL